MPFSILKNGDVNSVDQYLHQRANPPETPKAEHAENFQAKATAVVSEEDHAKFYGHCRADIKDEPAGHKTRPVVKICNEEGENDIDGKEAIYNVVDEEQSIWFVCQEGEVEWADPSGVDNQNNQKHLPSPETAENER
ncbi:hypothetical protein ACLOJK_010862 [Asimina triloba]